MTTSVLYLQNGRLPLVRGARQKTDARRYYSRSQLDNLDEPFGASWLNREALLSDFLRREIGRFNNARRG